jgi:CRISPR-associated protein Cas1
MRFDDGTENLKMRIPSSPIPIKDRNSMVFLQYGNLDVKDGAFVLIDENGVRIQIPIGGIACIMLEPGTRITHDAVALAADTGTLILWVGESGVRLYSAGQPGGARTDRLLYQAKLALDNDLRLKVIKEMYRRRFGEEPPQRRSVEQLRGIEGARTRSLYTFFAQKYNVIWKKRKYNPKNWNDSDQINKALSAANHCLYGICEAAILAAGYAPAIGFIHSGKPLSFVYDIADLYKFEITVPLAFKVIAEKDRTPVRTVRLRCRDAFRETRILSKLIPDIEDVLSAGGIKKPEPFKEAMPIPFEEEKGIGDVGHRN